MKVMTIVGTRPELIKMSEIIKKLDKYTNHIFVHTGQNYAVELNDIFYEDLDLRRPDYFLGVASTSLWNTVANIMIKIEEVLIKEKPDAVVILGDTNSALSGIVAKRMKIPLFHLEAGNRSFDDNVPEEINRRILDHIADVNMVYTENSRRYLIAEGIAKDRTFLMGSPMCEVINNNSDKFYVSKILDELNLVPNEYFVVSLHRDENLEIESNLYELVKAINTICDKYNLPVVLSTHPRTMKKIEEKSLKFHPLVMIHKPFGFIDYIKLQSKARCVISDSGTISEESSLLDFPAVTIRNAIERPEAVDTGSILMSGVNTESILSCIEMLNDYYGVNHYFPSDYWIDNCSDRVLRVILGFTGYVNRNVWHK